jgi:hypothetical protein
LQLNLELDKVLKKKSAVFCLHVLVVRTDVLEEHITTVARGSLPRPSYGIFSLQARKTQVFSPRRWRQYVPPNRRFIHEPHGIISQKTVLFIATALKKNSYID